MNVAKRLKPEGNLKIVYPNGGATYRQDIGRSAIIKALNTVQQYREALILLEMDPEPKYREELQKGYYDYNKAKMYFP